MGHLVDRLERRGYVERRPDPTDRRATLICLTERGWSQIRAALAIIATVEEEWAALLVDERMRHLRDPLTELRRLARPG